MQDFPLLSALIFVPLLAALACLFVRADGARWIALGATLANLALGILLWLNYQPGGPQWQFVENVPLGGRYLNSTLR